MWASTLKKTMCQFWFCILSPCSASTFCVVKSLNCGCGFCRVLSICELLQSQKCQVYKLCELLSQKDHSSGWGPRHSHRLVKTFFLHSCCLFFGGGGLGNTKNITLFLFICRLLPTCGFPPVSVENFLVIITSKLLSMYMQKVSVYVSQFSSQMCLQ